MIDIDRFKTPFTEKVWEKDWTILLRFQYF